MRIPDSKPHLYEVYHIFNLNAYRMVAYWSGVFVFRSFCVEGRYEELAKNRFQRGIYLVC